MEYRNVRVSESKILTHIHIAAFKNFFLTILGEKFLNTYYSACLRSDESICICAIDDNNRIVGFSMGCIRSKGFHKRLVQRNFLQFMVQGIVILFSKPRALYRLAENMEKNKSKNDNGEYADLLSIAVLPDNNGVGIGKELIKKFEEEVIKRGCFKIALTTDLNNNDSVLKFYKKTGYEVFYEFNSYPDRPMYKMIKNLM